MFGELIFKSNISLCSFCAGGVGKVNWLGVAYYNRLIDYMLSKG